MRRRVAKHGISVHAIAGTEVVLLGLDATEDAAEGLLGFRVEKATSARGRYRVLGGERPFKGGGAARLIQAFQWSDYTADPGKRYWYRVTSIYGKPEAMVEGTVVKVGIKTENPDDRKHGVYFNRGAAGSQAYSRRFGKYRRWYLDGRDRRGRIRVQAFLKPEDVPRREAYKWLSRGLEEAMLDFIAQANGPRYAIRAALYELTHAPAIQAFVDAIENGADVKIIHHAKQVSTLRLKLKRGEDIETVTTRADADPDVYKDRYVVRETEPDSVCRAANEAVARVGVSDPAHLKKLEDMMIERTNTTISHNKFVVLLKDGRPIQVWTGSTNFTPGGIFGQLNVGHVVRDAKVARRYHEYWKKLSTDPKKKSGRNDDANEGVRNWTVNQQPDLSGPPPSGITPVFSPRLGKGMLDWYADRLAAAENSVFVTFAFSIAKELFNKVKTGRRSRPGEPYLRYLLLEGKGGLLKNKVPVIRNVPQNRVAWGDTLRSNAEEDEHAQFIETLTGLNDHVNYLHTKFMLVDPLSDDPVVISGSANFSEASTLNNDENMLIIRGSTRVADIFLGEFMRLFNHFRYRNEMNALRTGRAVEARHQLVPNDSWTDAYYVDGDPLTAERELFA
jgi:phosphatidylserine/phosphatidylglycerophosphate/cardiolipin synthase-like enzyme